MNPDMISPLLKTLKLGDSIQLTIISYKKNNKIIKRSYKCTLIKKLGIEYEFSYKNFKLFKNILKIFDEEFNDKSYSSIFIGNNIFNYSNYYLNYVSHNDKYIKNYVHIKKI